MMESRVVIYACSVSQVMYCKVIDWLITRGKRDAEKKGYGKQSEETREEDRERETDGRDIREGEIKKARVV